MSEVKMSTEQLKNISTFIAAAEGKLSKQASYEKAASAELESIVDGLVDAGMVEANLKSASIAAMKEDPSQALVLLKQAGEHLALAQTTGSSEKLASQAELTADQVFVKTLMGE